MNEDRDPRRKPHVTLYLAHPGTRCECDTPSPHDAKWFLKWKAGDIRGSAVCCLRNLSATYDRAIAQQRLQSQS